MGQVGTNNNSAALERSDGWFVQVGFGDRVPDGTYALEYQEVSIDQHFRCQTTDREAAVRLLQEFLAGDETWKRRHQWRPLANEPIPISDPGVARRGVRGAQEMRRCVSARLPATRRRPRGR